MRLLLGFAKQLRRDGYLVLDEVSVEKAFAKRLPWAAKVMHVLFLCHRELLLIYQQRVLYVRIGLDAIEVDLQLYQRQCCSGFQSGQCHLCAQQTQGLSQTDNASGDGRIENGDTSN